MTHGRAWLDRLIGWSPVFLLGAFAALTYWLNAQVQPGGAAYDGSGRHDTDLYIEDFKAGSGNRSPPGLRDITRTTTPPSSSRR
jgi:hypothetical protein